MGVSMLLRLVFIDAQAQAGSRPFEFADVTGEFESARAAIVGARNSAEGQGPRCAAFQIRDAGSGETLESWIREAGAPDGWVRRQERLAEDEEEALCLVGHQETRQAETEHRAAFDWLIWGGYVWHAPGQGWALTAAGRMAFDHLCMD